MTRFRALRASVAALMALMLIGPIGANAATPNLVAQFTPLPSTGVQDGELVAFRARITNADTSTVSQLFLVETTRDPNLTFVSVGTTQGSCTGSNTELIGCTLKQLKPLKTATVTAVFRSRAVTTGEVQYPVVEAMEFNTVGLGSGSGDNSHGDKWPSPAGSLSVTVSDDGDLAGRYIDTTALLTVQNDQNLTSTNPHSTKAFAPITGIGVSVEDIDCSLTDPDPICALLPDGFGQISKVNVNEGIDVSGTPATTLLHFFIGIDASEIPAGNTNSIQIVHSYIDEETGLQATETISIRCQLNKKTGLPTNAPCISVKNLPGGDLGIDVWTFHNGGFKPGLG